MTDYCFSGTGKTGFDFLNDPPGARSAAMGGAVSAAGDDAEASLWNPSILAGLRQRQASVGYASRLDGMAQASLAYGHPVASGALGLGVRTLDSGDIPSYDDQDGAKAAYDAKDLCLSAGYARASGAFRWGVNVKQVRETLAGRSADAVAADVGVGFQKKSWPVALGAALRNAGGKASFLREKVALPRSLDLGAAARFLGEAVVVTAESRRGADGDSSFAAGAEAWLYNVLALRAGWEGGERAGDGATLGLGIRLRDLRVDFAFAGHGRGFSPTHRMGISWRFGGAGERAYQEGLGLLQRGQAAEAVLKFQQALDADPGHAPAIRAMREAVRRVREEMREDRLPGEEER